jgi:hypothetical protein
MPAMPFSSGPLILLPFTAIRDQRYSTKLILMES